MAKKLLAVLGNPVEHSRSPEIHHHFAASVDLDVAYKKVFVPEGDFEKVARNFLAQGAAGFNVTVPNKKQAFLMADELTQSAQLAQAVNTIELLPNGNLKGHNTDGPGLVADITTNLVWPIKGKKLLILGAGGAVQGVVGSLLEASPAQIVITNRTHQRAVDLVQQFSDARLVAKKVADLNVTYDLVISGSSAGLSAEAIEGSLPVNAVADSTHCYDMIYAQQLTPFLCLCQASGAHKLSDGLGMLVEQAALAFEIWCGKAVDTRPVIQRLRQD